MHVLLFAIAAATAVPDYAVPQNWAVTPEHEGAAAVVIEGTSPRVNKPDVDTFFVHPTTDQSTVNANQDLADDKVNGWTDASVIARQASTFNGCCRVFAPRYRQATHQALAAGKPGRDAAFDLAYRDVKRAFDHYLAHENGGRPFILAGHSQGSSHLARLIEERIDGTPLANKMVVAYLIGFNLSEGDFGKTYKQVRPCAAPRQTGCILQWNAMLSEPGPLQRARAEARYVERWGTDSGKTLLCVNPLTFHVKRTAAQRGASTGAIPGAPGFGPIRPLLARSVAARCKDGFLIVDPSPALELQQLASGSMHYHDIGLFYADIRADTHRRIAAWQRQ